MKLEKFVKETIRSNKIKTQIDLVKHLTKAGLSVTQSNLSRILKKINAIKIIDEDNKSITSFNPNLWKYKDGLKILSVQSKIMEV